MPKKKTSKKAEVESKEETKVVEKKESKASAKTLKLKYGIVSIFGGGQRTFTAGTTVTVGKEIDQEQYDRIKDKHK